MLSSSPVPPLALKEIVYVVELPELLPLLVCCVFGVEVSSVVAAACSVYGTSTYTSFVSRVAGVVISCVGLPGVSAVDVSDVPCVVSAVASTVTSAVVSPVLEVSSPPLPLAAETAISIITTTATAPMSAYIFKLPPLPPFPDLLPDTMLSSLPSMRSSFPSARICSNCSSVISAVTVSGVLKSS